MAGQGHRIIRTWAVDKIPSWQKSLAADALDSVLCKEALSLQDKHAGGNSPDLDNYCVIPGVKVSLHDVAQPSVASKSIQWFLRNICENIEKGQTGEAMKFLGILCHWNEDTLWPGAHCSPVTETVLRQLVPPPTEKQNLNYLFGYGGIADTGQYSIPDESYQPRLLGASIPEAAVRLHQRQRKLSRQASSFILPLVQDTMYGDGSEAAKVRAEVAHVAGRHSADIIYTALCLAYDRIDEKEESEFEKQKLTDWLPVFEGAMIPHPYYVTPFLIDQSMDADRNLHPLSFYGEDGAVGFGFGMGTPFSLQFCIAPGTVFGRFTCRAGLHPTAGPNGKVVFRVRVDGEIISSSQPVASGDSPADLCADFPLTEILNLTLETAAEEGSEPSHNLTVWAEPCLHRAADDPAPQPNDK